MRYIVSRGHFDMGQNGHVIQHGKQAISPSDRSRISRAITTPYNHVIRHATRRSSPKTRVHSDRGYWSKLFNFILEYVSQFDFWDIFTNKI